MLYRIIIEPQQITNEYIHLTKVQLHYLETVVRLTTGDRFIAMDGEGNSWLVSLQNNQGIINATLDPPSSELSWRLTLVTAIVKGDGFAEIVRCCTELGVSRIIPTLTSRTLNQPSSHKLTRWRKIAAEAVEQSERQILPEITEPQSFSQVLSTVISSKSNNYICITRQEAPHLLKCLQQVKSSEIVILTGPEGGWTAAEMEQAIAAGCQGVNLGQRILRAVTAPIMATALVAGMCESVS